MLITRSCKIEWCIERDIHVVDQCKELQTSYCHYAFSAGIFSLVLYSEDEDFTTEGVDYDITPAGHRIYRELANVLTQ